MGKNPKIKALSLKYDFSLLSKSEIISTMNQVKDKMEYSVIKIYYEQRLPIVLCKDYLKLPKKSDLNDNEILFIACVKHQKQLLKNCRSYLSIIHIIDGLGYSCKIIYNSSTCLCGIDGYLWQTPNNLEYKRSYWLQDYHQPLIQIKSEPTLNMLQEYNILFHYLQEHVIPNKKINLKWIHSRNINQRIMVYPEYYLKYWQWEKYQNELEPKSANEWRQYFNNTGCANHRDLIETVHRLEYHGKNKYIDYRYGVTLS